jgi:hypothetical protein
MRSVIVQCPKRLVEGLFVRGFLKQTEAQASFVKPPLRLAKLPAQGDPYRSDKIPEVFECMMNKIWSELRTQLYFKVASAIGKRTCN